MGGWKSKIKNQKSKIKNGNRSDPALVTSNKNAIVSKWQRITPSDVVRTVRGSGWVPAPKSQTHLLPRAVLTTHPHRRIPVDAKIQ
jgi:hypothetical protein